jgi:hypothetical protein
MSKPLKQAAFEKPRTNLQRFGCKCDSALPRRMKKWKKRLGKSLEVPKGDGGLSSIGVALLLAKAF